MKMATGHQQESELESNDVTKWIEDSLRYLISCLKEERSASVLSKWPKIPEVPNKEDLFSTIKSISDQWDDYWKSCTELRRTDVQKAVIQIEKLTSKNPSTNLKCITQDTYHRGMLKDPVFVALQEIWYKLSDSPFTDIKTEESTTTEYSCINEWFHAYLQYLETVLNLERETYFVVDLIPRPPPQTDKKIMQSLEEIVVSWQELFSSKLSTEDEGTTKYIEAIRLIFVSGIQLRKKQRNRKKLKSIAKYFLSQYAEKLENRRESTHKKLPEDLQVAFKLGIYEKILDALEDRVNIESIEPPPVPNDCDECLKKQLNAEFQTALNALKKRISIPEDLDGSNQENGKSERKLKMVEEDNSDLSKAYKEEVEKSEQFLKDILNLVEVDVPTVDDKNPSPQYDDALKKLEKRLHMLKSEIVSFETKLSSCKSDAEEKIPSLREQLDREVKARELLQEEEKLKSEVLEKTLESILSSTEQFATEDLKNKYPADVWENTEPWVQKMKSYLEKIEVVKLNEKNEKSGLNFKLRTMEGLLTALKKNTMTTIGDVNAELESYDESTRKYLQKWYQKVQKRLESMLLEKNKIQCEIANLKHTQTELEENRDQLLNRLSQVAGAKLKENNPNITDLSDPNRPLKLAEQFSELYDKEWTNALEELSKTEMEEKSAIDLLLELITKCYQFCLRDSEQSLQTFLMCEDSDWRIGLNADEHHLLSETRKSLAKVHIRQIKERFLKENKMKKKSQKNLSHFITRSLELCWYMVIQNPPIHMEVHFPTDSPLIKSILKEYTISGDTISYLVWPPLYLHKDGPLLSKGVAQPQPKPKQRRQRQSTDRPATAPR